MKKESLKSSESSKNSAEKYKERIAELEGVLQHSQTKQQLNDVALYRMSVLEMMSEQLKTNRQLVKVLEKKLNSIAQQIFDFVKITAKDKGIDVEDEEEDTETEEDSEDDEEDEDE